MTLLLTLVGCCFLVLANADAEAGIEPFTAFGITEDVADDTSYLVGDSADYVDLLREERSQSGYNNLNSVYQPQASTYQPYQPYQPAAPAYQPSAPAYQPSAPTYQPSAPAGQPSAPSSPSYDDVQAVVPTEEKTETVIPTAPAPTFVDVFGYGIAEKTRRDTEDSKQFLLTIAQNEATLPLVNELIDSNPCVSDLEGLIALIEHYGNVIADAGPEFEKMFLTLESLRGERNITVLMHGSSDLLLTMDSVNTQLDLANLFLKCGGSSDEGIYAMREMALVIYKMSLLDSIPLLNFSQEVKDRLSRTALIVEAVTNVLDRFRKNAAKRDCFTSKDFLGDFINLTSETIDGLAEVLGVLGFFPAAKETRQYAAFTASIVGSLDKFDGFKFANGCNPGGLSRAATSISDMADIVSEVGIQALSIELGISFRLDLLP